MRHKSSEVSVGNVIIGGNSPLVIQSMTNTDTLNTEATVRQTIALVNSGCNMVRIATKGMKEADNLKLIKKELYKNNIYIPIVADIHFNPVIAETAARIVEKIRINPGNYIDRRQNKIKFSDRDYNLELEKISDKLFPLVKICKEYGTAIRVGTNYGSLSERILYKYGNTPKGMVISIIEFVEIFRELNFHNLVLSVKANDVKTMVKANRLLVDTMLNKNYYYPIHLGITEAGTGIAARVKSAAGIGSLLATGIGDTIRVSLTENPVNEIYFAKKLSMIYSKKHLLSQMPITQPDFCKSKDSILKFSYNSLSYDELIIRASTDVALWNEKQKTVNLSIDNGEKTEKKRCDTIVLEILQALKLKFSKTEFIACPSCGRTQFDIIAQLQKVKKALSDLPNLKIAVMGCIVNGIGEMADADYGYVGTSKGKVTIYKGKQVVLKNISNEVAVEKLVEIIKKNGDFK